MSCCISNTFLRATKHIKVNRSIYLRLYTRTCSTLQELFDEDFNLETQLNVLAMDEAMMQESSITNEKLEQIFSKIRETSIPQHKDQRQNILQFEDLFPLQSKSEIIEAQPTEIEQHTQPIQDYTHTSPIDKSEPKTQSVSINFMTEDDILSIPSTAVTKQLLSTKNNTIDNFGVHLYQLLQYNPSGIMEYDIESVYYKHFGCQYPFNYASSMMKYIIGCCSHLFIIRSDVLGRKLVLHRANIENEKYLNMDTMPYLKQTQLLHYLLTHNDKHRLSPCTHLRIFPSYINSNTLNEQLLALSELQNEFYKQFNGLFLCSNLYKLVNKFGAIKKISSGIGDLTDFYLMWHYVQEDLAGMNIMFKIWHILNKYHNGLKWNQIQQLYANQYGEILMFPEHFVSDRKHWSYFIQNDKNIYKIADPSLSDGKLILMEVHSDKSSTTFINAMVMKCFNIKDMKQRKYFLLDIVPLRNATIHDNVWKYILCFTRTQHAAYFYQKYHSTSDTKSNISINSVNRASVSKFNLMKLKTFLDDIIPESLPFSLSTPSESSIAPSSPNIRYSNPLPFQIPLGSATSLDNDDTQDVHRSVLEEYIQTKKQSANPMLSVPIKEEREVVISPQIIENLWGLLTHYIDGLTIEQIHHLYNTQSNANTARVRYDKLAADRIEEILTSASSWFTMNTLPNGEERWHHSKLYDLQNNTVLLKPESFILYEYLEEYIEGMNHGEILGKTRFRSNLLIHFKHENDAEKLLRTQNLNCKDIAIQVDEFSPKYSYDTILPAKWRPIRYESNFNNILTKELSKYASITPTELFDVLKKHNVLHYRIQTPVQLTRLLMDAYTPYIHISNKSGKRIDRFEDINDIIFASYARYPRRIPLSLQHQSASLNVVNKNYYNDIKQFFIKHRDGMSLSRFRIEFVRDFDYIPAVPSLTEFLKSCDVYSFYINKNSDSVDLYLLPMERYSDIDGNELFKYPFNGITLEGFPHEATTDGLTKFMSHCNIIRRGIDRYVVRYESEALANEAIKKFASQHIKDEGLVLVDNLPHLCNHVLTWTDYHSIY